MTWTIPEIEIEGDTLQVVLAFGNDRVTFVADVAFPTSRITVFSGLHAQGTGANTLGARSLINLARWVKDLLDVDELRVEGALRTSGARPGRRPAHLRYR